MRRLGLALLVSAAVAGPLRIVAAGEVTVLCPRGAQAALTAIAERFDDLVARGAAVGTTRVGVGRAGASPP